MALDKWCPSGTLQELGSVQELNLAAAAVLRQASNGQPEERL